MAQKQQAYASLVIPQNHQVIISESGSSFDMAILKIWVEKHGPGGFFVRAPVEEGEEKDPLDCQLFTSDQFHQLYKFEKGDVDSMFRPVRAID